MMPHAGRPLPVISAVLMAFAIVAGTTAPAGAQDTEEVSEDRLADFQQRLDSARARLQLSDEQVEKLLPLLGENIEATIAVLAEHGVDFQNLPEGRSKRRLSLRKLRALDRDLNEVREATYKKIEELGFLSEEQFSEFKKIQEEQREALRERLRERS